MQAPCSKQLGSGHLLVTFLDPFKWPFRGSTRDIKSNVHLERPYPVKNRLLVALLFHNLPSNNSDRQLERTIPNSYWCPQTCV